MTSSKKYDELHFFIDESGSFDSVKDLMLVGGVLLFGPYDQSVQAGMRKAIMDSLDKIKAQFPTDLHFTDLHKTPDRCKTFSNALSKNLQTWCEESNVCAYGILIRHQHDIFTDSSSILAERELDNRYLSMLWSLVEHFVFVNDEVSRRLTDDATIHLHIARRAFLFNKDKEVRQLAESLKWKVKEHHKLPNTYIIHSIVKEDELRGMFRIAIRDRWRLSKRELAPIDICSIIYEGKNGSTPALYLADILLGVERLRIYANRYGSTKIAQSTLPVLDILEYGRELEALSQCKSLLDSSDASALITSLEKNPPDPNDAQTQPIIAHLVDSYVKSPRPFHELFESALKKVDRPNERKIGLQLAEMLEFVYRQSQKTDWMAEFYSILIPFSAANHSGNYHQANRLWEQYLPLENELPRLGPEMGVEMEMNFRCRRAVSLMDQFQFAEAEQILVEIGTKEEQFLEIIAERFNAPPESFDRHRLGICYNTLAQACAFQSENPEKRDLAENLFRNALTCFTDKHDLERVWVYLGHLACDFPTEGKELWYEVESRLGDISGNEINLLEKPFVAAVRLKGCLVFGTQDDQIRFMNILREDLSDCPDSILNLHPYGLILQTLAKLNIALAAQTGDQKYLKQAKHFYTQAKRSLDHGSFLLQDLSSAMEQDRINRMELFKQNSPIPHTTLTNQNSRIPIRFNYW